MGDMKTPDFDDLLAAFDIPDIDAKEAIQSSPEEDRDEVGTNAEEREKGSPPCFSLLSCHSEPPVVSVIVKNRLGTKPPTDGATEPQIANGFEGSTTSNQGQVDTELWPRHSPSLNDNEGGCDKGVGLAQHTTDVMNSLKPHLYPESSIGTGPKSPPPPSLHSSSPHLPPRSPQTEETSLLDSSPPSPLQQNGTIKAGMKRVTHSDEDDSEPDLGSPLVIQESPEFVMPSPPKFKHRAKPQSELRGSTETTSCHISLPPPLSSSLALVKSKVQLAQGGRPSTPTHSSTAPQPHSPQDSLPSVNPGSASVQEEKYPEHVIDERDSPESPPPSQAVNHTAFDPQDELMESEPSQEDRPGDTEEQSEKTAGDVENEEKCGNGTSSEDPVSASAAQTGSSALRPLKVKIKMPSGNFTRTVTSAAPKRSVRARGSKPSPEGHNTRSRKEVSQQSLAVAVNQDAATLDGASTVRDKPAMTIKPKVSPTAVSITKTAALPSISSARVSPGGINLRSLGQKTFNSGVTLPAPAALLPPQSSSRPASIVNSTGAIISKSQTNLVEAFNKILNNKNLLPSYKPDLSSPPPAEWGLPLPAQGYRCLECGDAFALEQSLSRHYDRRSLRIEVTCNHCAKRLVFFNKCSLLLHAREHKERGLIMQCSHLVMKPVPVEQMIVQQEPTPNGVLSPSLLSPSSASSSSFLGQATPNAVPQPHQAITNKKADALQYIGNKCPECQAQFSSKEEVAQHFQEIKAAHTTSCTECSPPMLLPNSCSAAAHQRIHQGCQPHVCPECGGTAKQTLFQTHLDEICLHSARRIGYRCSSCLVVFGGLNSVKSHIQQAHCDMFHKCPSCPMAFKSAPSIQNHITAQHPTLTEGQAILIYKCVMCDTVFTHKSLLYVHFDTHLTNQKVHVFKCPECTKLFSQRNSLMDHFKTHKTLTFKQELPSSPATSSRSRPSVKLESSDGEDLMDQDKEEKVKTERIKTPSGWKCVPCHARYTDREEFIAHMAKQHNKGGRNEAESSSEQDNSLGTRRRRRGPMKTEQDEESTDGVSPVKKLRSSSAPAPYSLPESGFRCAPCGFTTEGQAAFLEHIVQHRRAGPEASDQQCLQCGACFTSISSLSRHRFIIHKVRDTDNQQALGARSAASPVNSRNHDSLDGFAPASPSSQLSMAQGKEEDGTLACKVCGKQFEKAADLNTHFRTHGMAFINARNAGKTT
eukprot:superscaffoldBa00000566_g5680